MLLIKMDAKEYLKYFAHNYKANLSQGIENIGVKVDRYSGFNVIFKELLAKKKSPFVIVETGCQRQEHDWGAGQSSLLFYEFLTCFGGRLISIDNNIFNLNICKRILRRNFPNSQAELVTILGNSVEKLGNIDEAVDLVYLDSYDLDPAKPVPSMVHHLKELASLRKIVSHSPDLLIALDDNAPGVGKGKYVLDWARETKQKILYNGYQIVIQIKN